MIKRFDLVGEYDNIIGEVEDGDYVLYNDYKKLEEKMPKNDVKLTDLIYRMVDVLKANFDIEELEYIKKNEPLECYPNILGEAISEIKQNPMK